MKKINILMSLIIVCGSIFSQNTDSSVDEIISGTWTFNKRLTAKGGITANAYLEVDSYGFNGRFANNYLWFTSNSYNPFAYIEQRGLGPINFRFKGVDKHVISENGIKIGSSGSTDIPEYALDVSGEGRFYGPNSYTLILRRTGTGNPGIRFDNNNGEGIANIYGGYQGNGGLKLRPLSGGANDMNLDRDGRLGIKCHPTATLDVNGNIKAHEIEVTLAAMEDLQLNGTLAANNITYTANGNTADFVFEDNYHLKDLSEVEAFIKANRHLPEIPSATEMEDAGVNLAEMNKLLLMKVEELTLYSIELEKEVKRQKAEVDEVRSSESAVRKEMKKMKDDRRRVTELEERLVKMESLLEKLTLNLPKGRDKL